LIINFSKSIYNKNSIYESKTIWNEYFTNIIITEDAYNLIVDATSNNNDIEIYKEFVNYVLDLNSSSNSYE